MKTGSDKQDWSFNAKGDVFTLKTTTPPRAWQNVHYAERGKRAYYSLFNNAGSGPVFVRDEEGNQTDLCPGERTVYFRDEQSGKTWTIPGYPVPQAVEEYRCEYTQAYTKLSSRCEGVAGSLRVFVPRGELFEIWTIEVANTTEMPKTISLFPYFSVDLMGFKILFRYGQTRMRWTHYHEEIQGLLTRNNSPFAPSDIYAAFLISAEKPTAATGKPASVLTPPYSPANPNLDGWKDRFITAYDENLMCLKTTVRLAPGERRTVQFAFGSAPDVAAIRPIFELISDNAAVEARLADLERHYQEMNARVQIATGDERIDRYINHWAPKQIESYLTFKKAWRDNLQIDMVFPALSYEQSLANLLDALSHQYEEGHAPHSFRPIIPLQYSDKPAWIPMAVAEVIKESGDLSILEIELPYIDQQGRATAYKETVLQHVMRAMRFMFKDIGVHQMSRMHYADWLDGLDGLSRVGEGESVLSTLMFAAGLLDVIGLAEATGNGELQGEACAMHAEVKRRLNENAWDGDWYLRGFSGNGEKVGSRDNEFGRVFLNAQSWAIIGGVADRERQERLLRTIDTMLETELGRRLYYPSYTRYFHHIGCVSAQPPEYAMNGIYNHAATFSMVAECLAGRGEKAWEVAQKVIPDGANNPSTQSQNEPFAVTNSFRLAPGYYGECGQAWRTNTAAWAYRGIVEFVLGVRKDYGGLRINPCLPRAIQQAKVTRIFRGATYEIALDNRSGIGKGVRSMVVDGRRIEGNLLPLAKAGTVMMVRAEV